MAERTNRRLATIVAADVAGYSRLVALDKEGTLSALRVHLRKLIDPKLAELAGRIANTAGDSLLIRSAGRDHGGHCRPHRQRGQGQRAGARGQQAAGESMPKHLAKLFLAGERRK